MKYISGNAHREVTPLLAKISKIVFSYKTIMVYVNQCLISCSMQGKKPYWHICILSIVMAKNPAEIGQWAGQYYLVCCLIHCMEVGPSQGWHTGFLHWVTQSLVTPLSLRIPLGRVLACLWLPYPLITLCVCSKLVPSDDPLMSSPNVFPERLQRLTGYWRNQIFASLPKSIFLVWCIFLISAANKNSA